MADSDKDKTRAKKTRPYVLPDRLTESYIITESHRKVGIYGERFIDVINQAGKQELTGQYSGGIIGITRESDGARTLQFSIKRLMANSLDTNYADAEDAMRKLESVFLEYRVDGVWSSRALITDPDIDEKNHIAKFRVPLEIWEASQKRETGFRCFNPAMGFKLSSDYSYRLYKLVCGQKSPLVRKISEIRAMLGCENKYAKLSDFLSRVIDPAMNDLKQNAEYYFTYTLSRSAGSRNKSAGRGRPPYDLITFHPKLNNEVEGVLDSRTIASHYNHGNLAAALPSNIRQYLVSKYAFTDEEIGKSRVIVPAYDIFVKNGKNLFEWLLDNTVIFDSATGDKKAYLVATLKNHVFREYGVALGATRPTTRPGGIENDRRRGDVASLEDLFADEVDR